MSTRAAVFATLIIAQTGSAQAEALLCMGIAPGFLMVVEGDTTTFDYLGDGDFDLDPALPLAISTSIFVATIFALMGIPS